MGGVLQQQSRETGLIIKSSTRRHFFLTDFRFWPTDAFQILKIDPKAGKLLAEVQLPAYQITSAAFGGPNLDQLYVTTAGYQLTDAQKSKRPYSGAVFRVTGTGSTGFPGTPVKIHLCPENPLDTI